MEGAEGVTWDGVLSLQFRRLIEKKVMKLLWRRRSVALVLSRSLFFWEKFIAIIV